MFNCFSFHFWEHRNMAKKKSSNGSVNKSQAIRDALSKDPKASPSALSTELNAQGVAVTPAYVSMIKSSMKSKAKGGRKGRAAGSAGGAITPNDLLEAKKLVDRVGGIEKAES